MPKSTAYPTRIFDESPIDPVHIGMTLYPSTYSYEIVRQVLDDDRHILARDHDIQLELHLPRHTANMNSTISNIINLLPRYIPSSKRTDVTFTLVNASDFHKAQINLEWKQVTCDQAKKLFLEQKPAILEATKQSWLQKLRRCMS